MVNKASHVECLELLRWVRSCRIIIFKEYCVGMPSSCLPYRIMPAIRLRQKSRWFALGSNAKQLCLTPVPVITSIVGKQWNKTYFMDFISQYCNAYIYLFTYHIYWIFNNVVLCGVFHISIPSAFYIYTRKKTGKK